MRGKFEIQTRPAEPRRPEPGRYRVLRSERCINCGECIRRCIYGVHERQGADPRHMAEPISERCRACLVCPQQCPRRALEVVAEPALAELGTAPYDSEALLTLWQEAVDGKIPVRGAGYGGPFSGPGFDGIWTDMSEIVRPTRDGIHGREYISTEVDLGRKLGDLAGLRFDAEGRLLERIPLTRTIPLPVLFGRAPFGPGGLRLTAAAVRAAMELQTFCLLDLDQIGRTRAAEPDGDRDQRAERILRENSNHLVLHLDDRAFDPDGGLCFAPPAGDGWLPAAELTRWASVLELADSPALLERIAALRALNPDLILLVEIAAADTAGRRAVELARAGVDGLHLRCGWRGSCTPDPADPQADPHAVVGAIRQVHRALVGAGLRDRLSLLAEGGISRAEHVPKAILLGADAVVLDVPPLAALGCRVCTRCLDAGAACAQELGRIDPAWGAQRLVNLMAAWRNQLLEVLGAMGLRDVRRLRGEVGRGLFAAELERGFAAELTPLGEADRPLSIPAAAEPAPQAPAAERMRNRYGLWRVRRGEGCIGCGTCAAVCRHGALRWPAGLRRPPPPIDERCAGPDCGADCSAACPSGALAVEPDERLGVVDNRRWTHRLLVECWQRAESGRARASGTAAATGASGGGFDRLELVADGPALEPEQVDLALELNRRTAGPQLRLPLPVYGGGMSYGSISLEVMLGRARAAQAVGSLTCTGEGGFPEELAPYAEHVITQIATGYFGVREETIQRARVVEFKYAQGAKPGLGGHLLGDKNTPTVARLREAVPGSALFSPFPFHSVYSIEDHRKHVDWVRQINPDALVSVKVSTPGDVDMVAVGSYHAGANIIHLDGAYGGTGAAPEVAKKNIAMPIELALSRTHRFLVAEGIRDDLVLIASGGLRTPADVIKAIALGADGVVIGTAELVAISCVLCRNCEKDRGCPRGIATTDPELAAWLDADWVAARITNLYRCWARELRGLLAQMGLGSIGALRGRADLLRLRPAAAEDDRP